MPETGCPSFREVMLYLFFVIFSLAVIGYTGLGAGNGNGVVPLFAIITQAAAIILLMYSSARLILLLFPARKRTCPVCRLLAKVIEID